VPQAGTLAVLGFFFVSGYLISKLLSETYLGRPKDFIINRFLRIYPIYWASLIIGCILIILIPDALKLTNKAIFFPVRINTIFDNILIFGLKGNLARIVPPAWSLDVELSWYLIFFVLSFFSTNIKKYVFFLVSLAVLAFIIPEKQPIYGDVLGSGFAFSFGALHYYYKPKFHKIISITSLLAIVPFMYILPHIIRGHQAFYNEGFPFNWSLMIAIIGLFYLSFQHFVSETDQEKPLENVSKMTSFHQSFSRLLGSLSYPMFLTHWYSSAIILFMFDIPKRTLAFFVCVFLLTLLISYILVFCVEKPIAKYRDYIRGKSLS
jgi:peptidoglycan/LPS O-acetylase OafA/YrhL